MSLNGNKIFEEFERFNPLSRKAVTESPLLKDFYTIAWEINSNCNYNCFYCINPANKTDSERTRSADEILHAFERTKKRWIICFTGGEPFLYPDYINLISELSEKHIIDINTNLSTDNIYALPQIKNPSSIIGLYASYHVVEREKNHGVNDFIDKVLFLQEQKLHTIVSYLAHPLLLDRIESDFDFLLGKGIKNLAPKKFIGNYKGKLYPESYSAENIEMFKRLKNCFELDIIDFDQHTAGRKCFAGKKYFFMNKYGDLFRCASDLKPHGNFFEGNIKYDFLVKKCTANKCGCPFEGVLSSKAK